MIGCEEPTLLQLGSLGLTAGALAGVWLLAHGNNRGWLVMMGEQFLWLPYALFTEQFSFALSAVFYFQQSYYGWRHRSMSTTAIAPASECADMSAADLVALLDKAAHEVGADESVFTHLAMLRDWADGL